MHTDVCNEPAACIFKIKALYDEKEEEYSSFKVFYGDVVEHYVFLVYETTSLDNHFLSFRRNILPSKDWEEIDQ
jgi:hypothetical protein